MGKKDKNEPEPSEFVRQMHEAWRRSAAGEDSAAQRVRCVRLSGELWETLKQKPNTFFDEPLEVYQFLLNRFRELGDEFSDQHTEILADELAGGPKRSWTFAVVLGSWPAFNRELGESITLGPDGPRRMTLRAVDQHAVLLLGTVEAPTRGGALVQAERTLDSFLGATLALDLAWFFREGGGSRVKRARRESSLREIQIEDEVSHLGSLYADRLEGYRLHASVGDNLELLEGSPVENDQLTFKRRLKQLEKVLCGDSEQAHNVRASCRLAMNAEDANDFGVFISLAFTCIEGLLLDHTEKEDVTARLAEAAAYLLGRNAREVVERRDEVKKLYKARSTFAHSGITHETPRTRAKVQRLLRSVLFRQIERLPDDSGKPSDGPDGT